VHGLARDAVERAGVEAVDALELDRELELHQVDPKRGSA
jgi:hypothetical protein